MTPPPATLGSAAPRVIAAAIVGDGTQVWTLPPPARHHDVIAFMRASGYRGDVSGDRQGFVIAPLGRFASRKAAWVIAEAAGQLTRLPGGVEGLLFSEILW